MFWMLLHQKTVLSFNKRIHKCALIVTLFTTPLLFTLVFDIGDSFHCVVYKKKPIFLAL